MSNEAPVYEQATDGSHQSVDNAPTAPHRPDVNGNYDSLQDINLNEKQIFDYLLKPGDSYTRDGM
jgi:hypothetical protein